jgi:type II secretory pathway component PulF
MFFRTLPIPALLELCRSMRYALGSGLMLRDVMDLLANKGTRSVRPVSARICKDLKAGWSLQDALKKQEDCFPPLFLALTTVGEESGNLPEVLLELEKYYEMQQKLRRDFWSQINWPIVQFVSSLLIVALLIVILGEIAIARPGSPPVDALGLGLFGKSGAIVFLGTVTAGLLTATLLFLVLKRLLRRRAVVERFLLALPGIGPCVRAVAMMHFCVAGRLMLDTTLSVVKMLRLAFLATDNAAFTTTIPRVEGSLRQGNSITTALTTAGVFSEKFLAAVAVAEESGRLPESLAYQGKEYEDETRRRLAFLTRLAGSLVWLGIAAVIITCIFRIFMVVYVGNIEKVLPH